LSVLARDGSARSHSLEGPRPGTAPAPGRPDRRGAAPNPGPFTSTIGPGIAKYVAYTQGLGRRYDTQPQPRSVRPLPCRTRRLRPDRRGFLRVALLDRARNGRRTPQAPAACPPVLSLPSAERAPLIRSRPDPVSAAFNRLVEANILGAAQADLTGWIIGANDEFLRIRGSPCNPRTAPRSDWVSRIPRTPGEASTSAGRPRPERSLP
jgi:hypothetical protein